MIRWDSFPLFVYLLVLSGIAMMLPATHALRLEQFALARSFFYSGLLVLLASLLLSLAMMNRTSRLANRSHLSTLIAAYVGLPLVLLIPILDMVPEATLIHSYFEMVSSLTTTGATLFPDHTSVSEVLHLWRAEVAWFGGLLALIAALAIMEPLNLGGFEIRSTIIGTRPGEGAVRRTLAGGEDRILRQARIITPIYLALTAVLSLGLILLGDRPFVAVCHAMSIVSTSGISPIGGLGAAPSGYGGEGLMLLFMCVALSHRVISDLLLIVYFKRYQNRPIHFFGTLGILTFGAGAVIDIYFLVLKILGNDIWGKPLLLLGFMLTIGGIQIITIGIISEILMRTKS